MAYSSMNSSENRREVLAGLGFFSRRGMSLFPSYCCRGCIATGNGRVRTILGISEIMYTISIDMEIERAIGSKAQTSHLILCDAELGIIMTSAREHTGIAIFTEITVTRAPLALLGRETGWKLSPRGKTAQSLIYRLIISFIYRLTIHFTATLRIIIYSRISFSLIENNNHFN